HSPESTGRADPAELLRPAGSVGCEPERGIHESGSLPGTVPCRLAADRRQLDPVRYPARPACLSWPAELLSGPIIMRISTNLMFATGQKTINTQQSDLMHLYRQIGTGQRMV